MRKSWCIHHTGAARHDQPRCAVGVHYRDLVGGKDFGWLRRIPCNGENNTDIICEKRQFPTEEQIAEFERRSNEMFTNSMAAREIIMSTTKGKPGVGKIDCPICGVAELHYSISSYNGHVHAQCDREGCVSWME